MSKFFVNAGAIDRVNNIITITGDDVRHIKDVLRSAPGDTLALSDGSGTEYAVVIEKLEKDRVLTKIKGTSPNRTEPPLFITLFQGMPKAGKMEYILQKCVEVGVSRFVPVMTGRSVVKIGGKRDAASKAARWGRIAAEAAKQCDRGIVPAVEEPVGMEEALKLAEDCGLKIMPYEEETEGSLRKCLEEHKPALLQPRSGQRSLCPVKRAAIFIGPEGGFEPGEVEEAVRSGFRTVTLGPRILRTETAGLVVASIIMYELGDMEQN